MNSPNTSWVCGAATSLLVVILAGINTEHSLVHAETEAAGPSVSPPNMIPPAPFQFSQLESRSISPGNPTGAKGGAYRAILHPPKKGEQPGDKFTLHSTTIPVGETKTLADIDGPGMIRSFWLTFPERTPEMLRSYVIRIYWDDSELPSVEAPIGDFFGLSHGRAAHYFTPYLGASEGKGYYSFFPMPFSKRCRITIENDSPKPAKSFFYQINYTLGDKVTDSMGRFHASFRREQPPKGEPFVMLDTEGTPGVYVGAVISGLPQEPGTWREGDIRFYIDGDTDRATIVGTGWSDWFLSAWGLGIHQSLYAGSSYQVIHPEKKNKYFATCYRFHVLDPIYFHTSLRVEYTQVGAPRKPNRVFSKRSDDWCSTVYWYQKITDKPLPPLPDREHRIAGIAKPDWEAEAIRRMRKGIDRKDD